MPREYSVGKKISELETPCLLVDLDVVKRNCQAMTRKAEDAGIQLRGHVKTHKSIEAGIIQTNGTKKCIVTSTLMESEFFANAGFDDILYAYPISPTDMKRNTELAKKLENYHLMVATKESLDILLAYKLPDDKKWSVFLSIDTGDGREGFFWKNSNEYLEIAHQLSKHKDQITLCGIYTHCGHTYAAAPTEVNQVRNKTIDNILYVKEKLTDANVSISTVGIGSTPSCSRNNDDVYKGLTEIHPGNYVFYDVQQEMLGSCSLSDIAVCVATRILGHSTEHGHLLIDCGFTGLTKQGFQQMGNRHAYIKDHPELLLISMTQELGKVKSKDGKKLTFDEYPIGSMLYLFPYHSCATAAMYPVYHVHKDGLVVDEWKPTRGR